MTVNVIQSTTMALEDLINSDIDPETIFVGPPSKAPDSAIASLFLYHLVPNAEMRNELNVSGLRGTAAAEGVELKSIPFELRYMITVYSSSDGDPKEQQVLGQIIKTLHVTPVLTGARLPGQTVRLTPDPLSMEEISRVWGLFPGKAYQTSIVYLATPVYVDASEVHAGPRVHEIHRNHGQLQKVARS